MTKQTLCHPPFVLLDDSRPPHKASASWLFHTPERIITATDFNDLAQAFSDIDSAVAEGLHVAGWISYEAAHFFEPKLAKVITRKADEPLVWMMVTQNREKLQSDQIESLLQTTISASDTLVELSLEKEGSRKEAYVDALDKIQRYIAAGDVYQINYTFPQSVLLSGDSLSLYRRLRETQPVAYGAFINTGDHQILSLSPELFVEKRGETLLSRPMKGTAPRGLTSTEDEIIQKSLQSDAKSRAENLMIVDLIRNDISKISMPGSVNVETLFATEQYATLHQMTSDVRSIAKKGLMPSDLLAAMFPCGSVTGAPKIRAMEIIQTLEQQGRGVYCGAIGHFSGSSKNKIGQHAEDQWTLSVPIRTMVLKENAGRLSVGSGIVADSNAQAEYDECLLKGKFAAATNEAHEFSLIETMKLEAGVCQHLPLHLARLQASATYFDYAYDETSVKEALDLYIASKCISIGCYRIRLLLNKKGQVTITSAAFPAEPEGYNSEEQSLRVSLSDEKVRSSDVFLRHKTTNRLVYDQAYKNATAQGFADTLFFNEKGELTEGAISNVFIVKNEVWYTPPLESGVLSGIYREQLLASRSDIKVQPIYKEELLAADKVFIANALRGLRQVTIQSGDALVV